MKYILMIVFLTIYTYGQGINMYENRNIFSDNNWCIDSDEVEEWTLVDRKGKLYVFTDTEMNAMSNEDYYMIVENLRVKKVIFRDIIPSN